MTTIQAKASELAIGAAEDIAQFVFKRKKTITDTIERRLSSRVSISSLFSDTDYDDSTAPRNTSIYNDDFFADSPYFRAHIEKEMKDLKYRSDVIKDICQKTKVLAKTGESMSKRTRRLALSCKLDLTDESSPDEVKKRRDALGHDIFDILKHLGEVLEELASRQDSLQEFIERDVVSNLEDFINKENKTISLHKEAVSQTSESEKQLLRYIDDGNKRLQKSSKQKKKKALKHGSSKEKKNLVLESPASIADCKLDLEKLQVRMTVAEIKRFQLCESIMATKLDQSHVLSENAANLFHGMQHNFSTCKSKMALCTPKIQELEEKCLTVRRVQASSVPAWQERDTALLEKLEQVQKAQSDAEFTFNNIGNKGPVEYHGESMNVETLEKESEIWQMETRLRECTKHPRIAKPGIMIEGWLYQKTSTLLTSDWNRHWFILRHDGMHFFESNDYPSSSKMIQVCNLLCTIREFKSSDFEHDPSLRFCFELVTAKNESIVLKARGKMEYRMWVSGMRSMIENKLLKGAYNFKDMNQAESKEVQSDDIDNSSKLVWKQSSSDAKLDVVWKRNSSIDAIPRNDDIIIEEDIEWNRANPKQIDFIEGSIKEISQRRYRRRPTEMDCNKEDINNREKCNNRNRQRPNIIDPRRDSGQERYNQRQSSKDRYKQLNRARMKRDESKQANGGRSKYNQQSRIRPRHNESKEVSDKDKFNSRRRDLPKQSGRQQYSSNESNRTYGWQRVNPREDKYKEDIDKYSKNHGRPSKKVNQNNFNKDKKWDVNSTIQWQRFGSKEDTIENTEQNLDESELSYPEEVQDETTSWKAPQEYWK